RSARPRTVPDSCRCRRSPVVSAVELRPEESRCRLQDLIGPAQLPILSLELGDPRALVSSEPRAVARLDLLLDHPPPQRLASEAELLGDGGQAAIAESSRITPLPHQADRSFPELVWIHPRSCHGAPSFLHG